MVGRPKKHSVFRGALSNGSEKIIYSKTENKDFALQRSTTILNSSSIAIPFHPIDSYREVTQFRFFGTDHVYFTDFVPSPEAGVPQTYGNCFFRSIIFFVSETKDNHII